MATAKKAAPAKKAAAPTKKVTPVKKAAAAAKRAEPAKKAAPGRRISDERISGFVTDQSGLLLPTAVAEPVVVPSNKLREGIEAAQGQIKKTLQGFATMFTEEFEVSEISLTLSFSADGMFLGFGAGGAMSVSIKIVPASE